MSCYSSYNKLSQNLRPETFELKIGNNIICCLIVKPTYETVKLIRLVFTNEII